MVTLDVPGVSVTVVAEGRVAWARGWGLRDASTSDPIAESTLFQAASISKAVTAVAVMRLVQEGRLNLDEDVNVYLRSWRVPANGAWRPRITVRQLLGHVAGTTVHGFPGYRRDRPVPSLRQVLDGEPPANSPPVRVNTLPGLQFRYSGGGTSIVQQLLTDMVELPFPALMRELVLEPLGMRHSTYEQPLPQDRWAEAATGHRWLGGRVEGNWHIYPEMAAAGLWTTPSDLALLIVEIQNAQAGPAGRVLTKESVEAMLTPQATGPVGIGFFVAGEDDRRRFEHSGGNEGFRCRLLAYAEHGLGAVVMTNADAGWFLVEELLGAIAREYNWPLGAGERIGHLELPRPAIQLSSRDWAGHVGEYEVRPDYHVQVISDADLVLQLSGQPALVLVPTSSTVFYAEAVDLEVTFQQDQGGRTTGLVLRQNGTDVTARKED
jgi:CubicO group peptidase (beta-lactamase class C family)